MPINFTDSPADGAIITQGSSTFTYNSTKGVWNRARILEGVESSGLITYATLSALPLVGVEDDTLVKVLDTNKLYKWTGTGWYFLDPVNTNPTITTAGDAAYNLSTDGTPTVVTLAANDPEGFPIIWSYAVTAGSLGSTATVSQSNNVFTITPSTLEANEGGFTITFTASDGVNIDTSTSEFTLAWEFNMEYLIIGGGGGAGNNGGGGGGAGGLLSGTLEIDPNSTTYNIVVGSGGAAATSGHGADVTAGNNTIAFGLTAIGGGLGSSRDGGPNASVGGSGGGGGGADSGSRINGAAGTAGQGFAGGVCANFDVGNSASGVNNAGGGGGGAGGAGTRGTYRQGGNGGVGVISNITGAAVQYAAGGGGGKVVNGAQGVQGNGGDNPISIGGGGTGHSGLGNGADGAVILRAPTPASATTGSPTVTTDGAYTIYTFRNNGSITW